MTNAAAQELPPGCTCALMAPGTVIRCPRAEPRLPAAQPPPATSAAVVL